MGDHGTLSKYKYGCRCEPCALASRVYARELARHHTRKKVWGYDDGRVMRYELMVDSTETQRHLAWLRSEGIGLYTISKITGLSRTTLQQIARGKRPKVMQATESKILAVGKGDTRTYVDARPTWLLIEDLVYLGYTKRAIAHELGQKHALQLNRQRVSVKNAEAVKRVWDVLVRKAGPNHGTSAGYNTDRCRCIRCRAGEQERRQRSASDRQVAA